MDQPDWKKVNEILRNTEDSPTDEADDGVVNFQRKILPLDALNVAMEDLREQRLRNAAGRKKQQLVVCATLIDKIPNLGGMARTCEVMAACRLVLPDLAVCRQDSFKGLSVGAADWLEIEECKEEVSEISRVGGSDVCFVSASVRYVVESRVIIV